MAKKAKHDLIVGETKFEAGRVYSDEATKDCDPESFTDVPDENLGEEKISEPVNTTVESQVRDGESAEVKPADATVTEEKKPEVETVDHEVTQEDLDANPELVEEGVKVGDIIQYPKTDADLE